jgi:L-asparaginase
MKIQFLTTGGTIDKVYFDDRSEYEVGVSQIHEILRGASVAIDYDVREVLQKDSLHLTDEDRRLVRAAVEESVPNRVVVTHGTDTMVETAQALKRIPGKVIVLTGSLIPARFKHTDAEFNVAVAVAAVQCLDPGIYIAMNGRVFSPDNVRKNRERNCFEEVETSGD